MPITLRRVYNYALGFACLRESDVLLVSYPKSGNTWFRFVLGNLLSQLYWNGREVTFKDVDQTLLELGQDDLFPTWSYPKLPRFVKSHRPYTPLFGSKRSLLVIRDPRDVMVSHFEYVRHRPHLEMSYDFQTFIRSKRWGLEKWYRHTESWLKRATLVLSYEDMLKDDVGAFMRVRDEFFPGIDLELVEAAVVRSRFKELKRIESTTGHSKPGVFDESGAFFRAGTEAQWRSYFTDDDLQYHENLKREYRLPVYE